MLRFFTFQRDPNNLRMQRHRACLACGMISFLSFIMILVLVVVYFTTNPRPHITRRDPTPALHFRHHPKEIPMLQRQFQRNETKNETGHWEVHKIVEGEALILRQKTCTYQPTEEQMRRAYTQGKSVNVCRNKHEQDNMAINNCCFTITDITTPDPFVTFANGTYFMTYTTGDRVEIWSSPNLLDIGRSNKKTTVWRPPPNTNYSGGLWAPELHAIQGRWYVYVAAEDPKHGNKSHRMYVVGGPPSNQDPTTGNWEFLGPIAGMPNDQWAIDGTIMHLNGRMYFLYSGWPLGETHSDLIQELFIIELSGPTTAVSRAVSISQPHQSFEMTDNHGINEGPQVLVHPDGHSWIGIAYSCAGSWTKDYKMSTLKFAGGDPLDPRNWLKAAQPLIQRRKHGGSPFGPGHGSFLDVGGDTVGIFHATDGEADGWENRKARIQRVGWSQEGPYMGEVGPLVHSVQHYLAPAGTGLSGGFPGGGGGEKQHGVRQFKDEVMGFLKKF